MKEWFPQNSWDRAGTQPRLRCSVAHELGQRRGLSSPAVAMGDGIHNGIHTRVEVELGYPLVKVEIDALTPSQL
jgi:hypothetical protein